MKSHLFPWCFICAAAVNSCIGNLLVKESRVKPAAPGFVGLVTSPWFLAGLVFYGTSLLLFTKALERMKISVAYPAQAGLAFGLITLAGALFLGERLTLNHGVGMILVLAGITFMSQ
jgi:multidrug transporter EmrE-like cation transporter